MAIRVIDGEPMPAALGPYSQAVAAKGELIFVSGQPGINSETGEVPAGFREQARNAFDNLRKVLAAAGATTADVAKTTIYLADASDFAALNELFAENFADSPPTRAVPIVQLPKGLLISIEAVAVRR
jgi:2-iminobutanoate/2-iminopropanoate deaminase